MNVKHETIFKTEAANKQSVDVNKLNQAVSSTLGPNGSNVLISKDGKVAVTKDGVTVAKEFNIDDPLENIGASLVKQVSLQAAQLAGDGTTTATVLATAMFNVASRIKAIKPQTNSIQLKKWMDIALKDIVEGDLKKLAKPANSIEIVRNVARISVNGDSELGDIVTDAIEAATFNGVVNLDESKTSETYIETSEGLEFNSGYISPFFINNHEKSIVEYEKPLVMLFEGKISYINHLVPFIEYANKSKRSLLVICDGVDGEALNTVVVNSIQGNIWFVAVKSPGYGSVKFDNLSDIAVVTGSTIITERNGIDIKEIKVADVPNYLGSCGRIKVTEKSTSIIDGGGLSKSIDEHVEMLKSKMNAADPTTARLIHERVSKLTGGVATIKLGAKSELEANEKKDRIEDALCAVRAAIEEGYVPGGGSALAKISHIEHCLTYEDFSLGVKLLNDLELTTDELSYINASSDEELSYFVMSIACLSPILTMFNQIGYSNAEAWAHITSITKLKDNQPTWVGFDFKENTIVNDMETAKIIDPVKVTRIALEAATSIVGTMITTNCLMAKTLVTPPLVQPIHATL